jgi:uncharacterized protein
MQTTTPQKNSLGTWVAGLAGVIAVGIVLNTAINTGMTPATLLNIFSTRFLGIFIEAAPFLLLGTLASGLIESFVTREDMVRWIPRNVVGATLAGSFLGFAFPVCECGVIPVVRRLFNKGLPMSVGVAFLLAAPVINPVVLAATYVAFGFGPVFIGRFVLTLVVASAVGLVFALRARPQDVLRPQSLAPVMGGGVPATQARRVGLLPGLYNALRLATDEFFDMGKYMVIGTAIAAGMQTLISQEALLELGKGPVVSVLVMQGLAFLLSVCSTVDAFLALAFAGTFTTGSLIAFLTFGPMVDIKSLLMFAGVFKTRTLLYLVLLPGLMILLVCVWLNLNIGL